MGVVVWLRGDPSCSGGRPRWPRPEQGTWTSDRGPTAACCLRCRCRVACERAELREREAIKPPPCWSPGARSQPHDGENPEEEPTAQPELIEHLLCPRCLNARCALNAFTSHTQLTRYKALAYVRLGRKCGRRGFGDLPTLPRSAATGRHREQEPEAPGSRVIASRWHSRAQGGKEFAQRTRGAAREAPQTPHKGSLCGGKRVPFIAVRAEAAVRKEASAHVSREAWKGAMT